MFKPGPKPESISEAYHLRHQASETYARLYDRWRLARTDTESTRLWRLVEKAFMRCRRREYWTTIGVSYEQ